MLIIYITLTVVLKVVFAGFSAESLADRIVDCRSKWVITSDEGKDLCAIHIDLICNLSFFVNRPSWWACSSIKKYSGSGRSPCCLYRCSCPPLLYIPNCYIGGGKMRGCGRYSVCL